MFSTITSFLSPALQLGANTNNPPATTTAPSQPVVTDDSTEEDGEDKASRKDTVTIMGADEHGVLKKKKERTHESFIVVRPPPAKNNHPLNLQVQLVPPNSKEQRSLTSKRSSFDSTADTEEGAPLARTTSGRSEVSAHSANSASTSVTSFSSASTSSTSSARRMIIPLYNLQAHNVLANVIVDAGTDAKVAKFQKKGLEVVGLAMLEPVEVWPGASYDADVAPRNPAPLNPSTPQHPSFLGADQHQVHTPTSSAISLAASDLPSTQDDHTTPVPPPAASPSTPSTPQSDRNGPRKFFGKIFKKKASDVASPSPSPSTSPAKRPTPIPLDLAQETTPRASKRSSLLAMASGLTSQPNSPGPASPASFAGHHYQPRSGTLEISSHSALLAAQQQGPQVLGIQPMLYSPAFPPLGRHPKSYVWVVKRWLKGGGDGLFGGILSGSGIAPTNNGGSVEVRFEWTRSRTKRAHSKGAEASGVGEGNARKGKRRTLNGSNTSSMASLAAAPHHQQASSAASHQPQSSAMMTAEPKRTSRMSREMNGGNGKERSVDRDSRRSMSPGIRPGSAQGRHLLPRGDVAGEEEEDPGNESDPEDSDTPWTCSLVMRTQLPSTPRRHPLSLDGPPDACAQPEYQPPQVRVKVGAVIPTPHHPKVVSLFKIPFPLPDVEVDTATVRKRVVTPAGVARPTPSPASSPTGPNSPHNTVNSMSSGKQQQQQNGNGISSFGNGLSFGFGSGLVGPPRPPLMLTAEEIKDVVCCTGLWLVVREGFGGVGKERRPGDGWRIRA